MDTPNEDRGDVVTDDATEAEAVDRGDVVADDTVAQGAQTDEADTEGEDDAPAKAAGAEEETAQQEEGEEEAEQADPLVGQMIPMSRFKAQNLMLREAQAKLAELEAAQKETPAAAPAANDKTEAPAARDFAAEVAAVEAKLDAALEDNDTKAVLALNREIRAIERAQDQEAFESKLDAVQKETKATQEQLAQEAFDTTLTQLESQFPSIDSSSPAYNAHTFTLVQDLVRTYEAQGYASDDALIRATAMAFPDSDLGRDVLGTSEPPAKAEEAKPAVAPKAAPRGIKEKIAAAASTPPNLSAVGGENSDAAGLGSEVNPAQLTDEEFNALPAETLKRLRGDVVAA